MTIGEYSLNIFNVSLSFLAEIFQKAALHNIKRSY